MLTRTLRYSWQNIRGVYGLVLPRRGKKNNVGEHTLATRGDKINCSSTMCARIKPVSLPVYKKCFFLKAVGSYTLQNIKTQ